MPRVGMIDMWKRREQLMAEASDTYPGMNWTNKDLYATATMNYELSQPTVAKINPETGKPFVVDLKVVLRDHVNVDPDKWTPSFERRR